MLAAFLVCCAVLVIPAPAQSATPCPVAELEPGRDFQLDLGPYACVFADPTRAETLDTLHTKDGAARFAPVPSGLVDFGFGADRYWVHVKLHNATDRPGTWWITHDIPQADLVRVRLVSSDGTITNLLELNGDAPFSQREIPHRHLVSAINLSADAQAELVIDYITGQGTQMPIFAESVSAFIDRTQNETATHVLIISVLLGMGVISTLYFYSLEGPPALIYGAYVISVALLLAHMEGYAFQFIYPNWVAFNRIAFPMLGFGSLALGMLFVSRLTRTRIHNMTLYALVWLTVISLLAMVATAPYFLSLVSYKIGGLLVAGISSVVQVIVIFAAMRRGQSGAWLLLFAFISTSLAIVMVATGYLTKGLFPQELAGSAIRIGFLLEAVAFSGAIALRVREARRVRDQSLREQLRLYQESLRLSEAVRQAETDRQQAEEQAERSRDALSSTAHDIRQPLTSIQMLLTEGLDDPTKIEGNLRYIEDILRAGLDQDNAPLGAGQKNPVASGTTERFPVKLIFDNVAAMFADEARSKGIALTVIPSTADIIADPLTVMRVVSNLVSNAVNHASATRILLGCRHLAGQLRIEVHDDGIGMSPKELDQLSERGAKGQNSGGQGLGLAITKDLAAQSAIGFSLRSSPGRGTTGMITVPLAAPGPLTSETPDT